MSLCQGATINDFFNVYYSLCILPVKLSSGYGLWTNFQFAVCLNCTYMNTCYRTLTNGISKDNSEINLPSLSWKPPYFILTVKVLAWALPDRKFLARKESLSLSFITFGKCSVCPFKATLGYILIALPANVESLEQHTNRHFQIYF